MMFLRSLVLVLIWALPAQAQMNIQSVTSPGGITAWLVQDSGIPFTALEIQFRGGTSVDAPGKRGAVNLMTALIEEGAGNLDAQGFAAARDAMAASFSFRAYGDSVSVSAKFLTEFRDPAADLLRLALTEPRFDPAAVERVRGQVLAGLRADAKDPGTLASDMFNKLAFGDHPYGSSGDGTIESVTALTRDDILAAHKGALARDRIYIAAAGDISPEDLGKLLDTLFGGLPATGAPLPTRVEWTLSKGVTTVDFPTPQSVVIFGQGGLKRDDPDFFAAFILNEVLGGGRFSARLMNELREKRGLTYGISTNLAPMDQAEMWIGQFSSDNGKVAEAISVVQDEWQKVATDGITGQELSDAKTYMTGSYPLRFDSNGAIAKILVGMQMENLPIDYAVTRNAKVEAVTLADVKRVAARLMKPDALHFVVVGQPEGLPPTP
ncbi:MAG: pitrilysin family protein [Pseudomonadota bacterium]